MGSAWLTRGRLRGTGKSPKGAKPKEQGHRRTKAKEPTKQHTETQKSNTRLNTIGRAGKSPKIRSKAFHKNT